MERCLTHIRSPERAITSTTRSRGGEKNGAGVDAAGRIGRGVNRLAEIRASHFKPSQLCRSVTGLPEQERPHGTRMRPRRSVHRDAREHSRTRHPGVNREIPARYPTSSQSRSGRSRPAASCDGCSNTRTILQFRQLSATSCGSAARDLHRRNNGRQSSAILKVWCWRVFQCLSMTCGPPTGMTTPFVDRLIAAIARVSNLSLVTSNASDCQDSNVL